MITQTSQHAERVGSLPLGISALLGGLALIIGVGTLSYAGVLLLPSRIGGGDVLIFSVWWVALSLFFYHVSRLADRRGFLIRFLILISLVAAMIAVDVLMDMGDNPLTLTLAVAFWLYLFYLLSPTFFRQYRLIIIGIYSSVLVYFFYHRIIAGGYVHDEGFIIPLFLLPIPFLMLLWLYEQWRWFQNLKAEKSRAELALLRSQVNPHFFFNTLNNLYSLTVNQSAQAPEVILKLSDIMRYTIYEGEKDRVPMESEIAYLNNYLELHRIRHHQDVRVTFDTDISGAQEVAPLLFIILLENAIKHGVESKVSDACVDISLTADDRSISYRVTNNYDPSDRVTSGGIGLKNLQKRLELLYPKRHQLNISDNQGVYTAELILYPI